MIIPSPRRLAPDFYVLGTPHLPVYLLGQGTEWTLLEGGMHWMTELVYAQLRLVVPQLEHVRHWFITHAHYDHCGLLSTLYPRLPRVQVYASAKTVQVFQQAKSRAIIERFNQEVTRRRWVAEATATETVSLAELPVMPLPHSSVVQIGRHRTLRVLATPGHSACQLSLWDAEHSQLFAADALGEYHGAGEWLPLIFDDFQAYVESIRHLEGLKATTLALGHHQVLIGDEAVQAPRRSLTSLARFGDWLHTRLHAGSAPDQLAQELTARFATPSADFLPAGLHQQSMLRLIQVLQQANYTPTLEQSLV